MNQLDNDFFEAYKHLDKLCGEIFDCKNGISEYINQMERSTQGYRCVRSWESDYKNLKHIRWVRNQLAHESFPYSICTAEDITFTKLFYTRIMKQDDPFSRLRRIEQERSQRDHAKNGVGNSTYHKVYPETASLPQRKKQKQSTNGWLILLGAILLLLLYMLLK